MNIGVILLSVCLNCCAQLFIRKGMLQVGEMNMLRMAYNIGLLACITASTRSMAIIVLFLFHI